MAILKRRLLMQNGDGTTDSIRLETSSDLVMRDNGQSVEAGLTALESDKMDKSGGTFTGTVNTKLLNVDDSLIRLSKGLAGTGVRFSATTTGVELQAITDDSTIGVSNGVRLNGVTTPIAEADATNKKYVDDLIANAGGVNWEATPYTNMTYANSNDIFNCIFLSTERMNKMMRFVRGALFLNVKSETYSGSQTINFTLPAGFPALTFNTASNDVPMVTGTGAVKLSITGSGNKITFVLNQDKAAISKGLYVGCVFATIIE